jgi:hypothetical protein
MERKSTTTKLTYKLEVEFTEYYLEDKRVEECHGFHTFYDTNTIGYDLISAVVTTDNGFRMDITDLLDEDAIESLKPDY